MFSPNWNAHVEHGQRIFDTLMEGKGESPFAEIAVALRIEAFNSAFAIARLNELTYGHCRLGDGLLREFSNTQRGCAEMIQHARAIAAGHLILKALIPHEARVREMMKRRSIR
jgi:hypothetical protein